MIEEITWDTFDERTRIWLQVLSNIPVEAVVRMLRLDLNTGVATLHGVGGDRVLGVISMDDDSGREEAEVFTPMRGWIRNPPTAPIPYEAEYARTIALAVYYSPWTFSSGTSRWSGMRSTGCAGSRTTWMRVWT